MFVTFSPLLPCSFIFGLVPDFAFAMKVILAGHASFGLVIAAHCLWLVIGSVTYYTMLMGRLFWLICLLLSFCKFSAAHLLKNATVHAAFACSPTDLPFIHNGLLHSPFVDLPESIIDLCCIQASPRSWFAIRLVCLNAHTTCTLSPFLIHSYCASTVESF